MKIPLKSLVALSFLAFSTLSLADYWVYQPDPGSDTYYTAKIKDPFGGGDYSSFTGEKYDFSSANREIVEFYHNGVYKSFTETSFMIYEHHPILYPNYFIFENGELIDWAISPYNFRYSGTPGFSVTKAEVGGTWVRLPGIAPGVPEPSSYVMLGLGIAVVGFAARRKKKGE